MSSPLLNALLRGIGARVTQEFYAALTPPVDAGTASDARGIVRRCGYAVQEDGSGLGGASARRKVA